MNFAKESAVFANFANAVVADFYSYLKSLIDAGFGKRLMFGSDQMVWPEAIPHSIKNVENAPFLTEEQKQDIFYNNAARSYNIK